MGQGQTRVAADGVICFECLYDLREQPAGGVCPECGTPMAALAAGRWDWADIAWRRRVRWGVVWSMGEEVSFGVALVLMVLGMDGLWAGVVAFSLMGWCGLVGAWLVTARGAGDGSAWGRRVVRALAVGAAVAFAGAAAGQKWAWDVMLGDYELSFVAAVVLGFVNGVKLLAQFAWYAGLLRRVPGRPLVKATCVVGAGLAAGWAALSVMRWRNRDFDDVWVFVLALLWVAAILVKPAWEGVMWWVLRPGRGRAGGT